MIFWVVHLKNESCISVGNKISHLGRTGVDVGGGGDCFFRAVSHQLYGNPNNHFYVRSVGVQYLVHNPAQLIESNIIWAFLTRLFTKNFKSGNMG